MANGNINFNPTPQRDPIEALQQGIMSGAQLGLGIQQARQRQANLDLQRQQIQTENQLGKVRIASALLDRLFDGPFDINYANRVLQQPKAKELLTDAFGVDFSAAGTIEKQDIQGLKALRNSAKRIADAKDPSSELKRFRQVDLPGILSMASSMEEADKLLDISGQMIKQAGGEEQSDRRTLSNQFIKLSGDFMEVSSGWTRVREVAKLKTAAGDLALIFNFMKTQDPRSVVRESEFQSAADARAWLSRASSLGIPVPAKVIQSIQKLETGATLLPEQREDFLNTSKVLFDAAERNHKRIENQFRERAERLGINPRDIITDFRPSETRTKRVRQNGREFIIEVDEEGNFIREVKQ